MYNSYQLENRLSERLSEAITRIDWNNRETVITATNCLHDWKIIFYNRFDREMEKARELRKPSKS